MTAGGLAQRLREETATLHRVAERSAFMAALLSGRCDRRAYLQLLHHLVPIYAALEQGLPSVAHHPWLHGFWAPELARLPGLQADIQHLQALDGASPPALSAVPQAYAERIVTLTQAARAHPHGVPDTTAARLLAHAYVRYLGDLSGGQILRRVVRQSVGLDGGAGTAFYDFGPPAQVAALAQQMRAALQSLPATGEAADAAVQEAGWCFEQHLHLFDALQAISCPR